MTPPTVYYIVRLVDAFLATSSINDCLQSSGIYINMIWLLSWLATVIVTFTWANANITDFKAVEFKFMRDMAEAWVKEKQCTVPLSYLAYAFAMQESSNGASGNWNMYWMKYGWTRWVNKNSPMFNLYIEQKRTPNWYRIYYDRDDAIYDWMTLFYNKSNCKLTKNFVKSYLNWPNWGRKWVDNYYNSLIKLSDKYSKMKITKVETVKTKKRLKR